MWGSLVGGFVFFSLMFCSCMGKGEVKVLSKKEVSDVGVVDGSGVPVEGSSSVSSGVGFFGWWGRFRLLFVEERGVGSYMSFGGFVILVCEVVLGLVFFVLVSNGRGVV